MQEWERTLLFALVLSASLHVIAVLALDAAPGRGGHRLQQELWVRLPGDEPTVSGVADQLAKVALPQPGPDSGPKSAGRRIPAADQYFRKSDVDFPAVLVSRAALVIPEGAYVSRLAGRVRARIFIGADGSVDKIEILEAAPVAGVFEAAALEALRGMRYRAARIGGLPVRSQKIVDVVFDPRADRPEPGD
ncbi:MAG: energy transducer TonB [Betaproteobacteria bacterium]|nr:energy transducer TonB [Betaproteobacteria bacterium]